MTLNDCVFEENGKGGTTGPDMVSVFGGATVKINNSKFLNNVNDSIIFGVNGSIEVSECHFEGNTGCIYYGRKNGDAIFKTCMFVGGPTRTGAKSFYLEKGGEVELNDCELGGSTFNDESRVTIINGSSENNTTLPSIGLGETGSTKPNRGALASVFGEGSIAMIVALLALIASGVSIFLIVDMKNKLVPAAADADEKTEDEE